MYSTFHDNSVKFFEKHRISLRFTDALEETIAKLAQIDSSPTRCQFFQDKNDENYMYIGFDFDGQAMSPEAKNRLINYFHKKFRETLSRDNNSDKAHEGISQATNDPMEPESIVEDYGSCQYVFDEDKQLHCFRINCNYAEKYILPDIEAYINEAATSRPEELKSYQTKSAHVFVLDDLRKELIPFLETHLIDCSNVFEKTLLAMAGCQLNYKYCGAKPAKEPGKVTFNYDFGFHGMSQIDKYNLLEFFKKMGDETASYEYVDNQHCFTVNYETLNSLFAAFKNYINEASQTSSEFYQQLREESLKSSKIRRILLQRKMNELCQSDELEEAFNSLNLSVKYLENINLSINKANNEEGRQNLKQSLKNLIDYLNINLDQSSVFRNLIVTYVQKIQETVKQFLKAYKSRWWLITPLTPEYMLAENIKSEYARLALGRVDLANLRIPESQIPEQKRHDVNYPYKIEAHIASFMADSYKQTCKMKPDGTLIYPPGLESKDIEAREKLELDVYCAARSISKNEPLKKIEEKNFASSFLALFQTPQKDSPKQLSKREKFEEFLKAKGIEQTGESKFKLR